LIFHDRGLLLYSEKPIIGNPAIGDGFSTDDSATSAIFPNSYAPIFPFSGSLKIFVMTPVKNFGVSWRKSWAFLGKWEGRATGKILKFGFRLNRKPK